MERKIGLFSRFALANALEQELSRQRGFAGARHTFDQVKPVRRKSAGQDVVETGDAGFGKAGLRGLLHGGVAG